ncbi:MAG: hypothetical protein JST31_04065 [Actinobacteria bacterium]|nr:hypothetical protein [Actinomycetota bacterium]
MRKRSISVVATAVAATAALTASVALAGPTVTGPDGNTQSIEAVISPKKLPKKTTAPATLKVVTKTATTTAANGVPSPAVKATIDFAKGAVIFAKGLPTCNASVLQNVSTEIAEQKCGKAKIGSGVAHALLPVGAKVLPIEQKVTAFNGVPKGGKPTVLLHTYGTVPFQTTLVLNGTVINYNKQGYGPRLEIQIPLIAGGTGALTEFQVTINKKWSYKGKKVSFISAECPTKTLKTRSVFTYLDGQSLEALNSQPCTQKPEPKK